MIRSILAIAIGTAFFTAACISSLNPIYTEDDLVLDRSILGRWTDEEQSETWEFTCLDEKRYKLVHTDEKGQKAEFEAGLLKIGGKFFMDITPLKSRALSNELASGHVLRTHSFIQMVQEGRGYRISYLEPKWVSAFLEKEPNAVRHSIIGGEVVLTDSTKNLQKFIAAAIDSPGAFSSSATMKRREVVR
jgi:hypothetical protein